MNWESVAREPLAIQIHLGDSRAVVFLGTWLIFFSKKVASIIAFGSRYLGQTTITAVSAMFRREP